MGKGRKKTAYAVVLGRKCGIFTTWDECKAQVDGFPNAVFQGFYSWAEANAYLQAKAGPTHNAVAATQASAHPAHKAVAQHSQEYFDYASLSLPRPSSHDDQPPAAAALSTRPQEPRGQAPMSKNDWLLSRRIAFVSHGVRPSAAEEPPPAANEPPQSIASGAPLDESNTGYLMAARAVGGPPPRRLGKHARGITEPLGIDAQARRGADRTCLGGTVDVSELDAEQAHALALALDGESFFMTGGAGSGKSLTLKAIIQALRAKHIQAHPDLPEDLSNADAVAVCASTGIAAVPHSGTTLHAFAGVGLGKDSVQVLVGRVRHSKRAKKRWQRCRSLLVDEVSMIDADFLDRLDGVAKAVRASDAPFGGIQLILVGDFFQLPPPDDSARLCFHAACWRAVVRHSVVLHSIYRQRDDAFVTILNEMRRGRAALSAATSERLTAMVVESRQSHTDNISERPLQLHPLKKHAEDENRMCLAALPGGVQRYRAVDFRSNDEPGGLAAKWLDKLPVEESLDLKVGAPVLLLKNLDPPRLVNGSRGRVIRFEALGEEPGGVSSAPSPAAAAEPYCLYPLVQFDSGVRRLVTKEEWSLEEGGAMLARRVQIPLTSAWALSIHKAQGMTLADAELHLAHCFAPGQAYTALSRMSSLERTRLVSFDEAKVIADADVVAFYQSLQPLTA